MQSDKWLRCRLQFAADARRYTAKSLVSIESIRQKFAEDQFEFSKHAVDQSIVRQILVREVREAISGE